MCESSGDSRQPGYRRDPCRCHLIRPDHRDIAGKISQVGLWLYAKQRTLVLMATKTERLSLRLTPAQDAVLRRAAEARGESANEYVLRHAFAAAEADLADRRVFVVDDAAWSELQDLVSSPPLELPAAMAKLLSNPSVLEAS